VRQAHGPPGRGLVGLTRRLAVPGHLEQMRPHRFQPVVTGDPPVGFEPSEPLEAGPGALGHRDRDGVVQRHHRIVVDPQEQFVERGDLRPVGHLGTDGLVVDRGDRRLKLVGADAAPRQRRGDERDALGDLGLVPAPPVLLGQRDQLPGRARAGGPPGVGEQHQREQPGDLAVAGQQPADDPGKPDRLGRQVRAEQPGPGGGGVPFGEDQVEDVQDHREPLLPLGLVRHPEWHPAVRDLHLGASDPPAHRRLGDQERAGDLGCGQAADRAEGQRDLRGGRQRGVAAQEQQDERVVGLRDRGVGGRSQPLTGRDLPGGRFFPPPPGLLAAQQVGQPAGGDRDQPAARVARNALGRPLGGRRQQRLLHRVFGGVEVPVPPHQRAEDLRRQLAEQVLGRGLAHGQGSRSARDSATGRTSTKARSRMCSGPGQFARRAAIAVARSKLSQSTSQYPARTSSVSA